MPYMTSYIQSSFLIKFYRVYHPLWVPYLYPASITGMSQIYKTVKAINIKALLFA